MAEIKDRLTYYPHITTQGGKSRTKQSFRDQTDINEIVKRHAQTGLYDHLNNTQPTYGDFSQSTELLIALDTVAEARENFASLPADVRALCQNNPVQFLARLADPELFDDLVEAGLPVEDSYEVPESRKPPEPEPKPPAADEGTGE